jgi:hypothetical protein
MTKLRLLLSILGLSILLFSCGSEEEPEPLDVQGAMVGTYTGFRLSEITFNGETSVVSDTFNIVVSKGRDTKTMIFTETAATLKEELYRYEVTLETEASDGATFTIAEQDFQGEPLQGEDIFSSQPGVHGVYTIDKDKSTEKIDFTLRIKATNYEYVFDKN